MNQSPFKTWWESEQLNEESDEESTPNDCCKIYDLEYIPVIEEQLPLFMLPLTPCVNFMINLRNDVCVVYFARHQNSSRELIVMLRFFVTP